MKTLVVYDSAYGNTEQIAKAIVGGLPGQAIAQPEGFFVRDKEGPLKPGELERANTWAKHLDQKG